MTLKSHHVRQLKELPLSEIYFGTLIYSKELKSYGFVTEIIKSFNDTVMFTIWWTAIGTNCKGYIHSLCSFEILE